ncbi:type I-U CRISPR-associated RAMP protein Csb1/Cas7u [Saccharopolyspora sp. NPDC050389]|uniref:type I-G CRISPR-associated RAMP protein Csb1/Cas7g n=1 Tax=Saccharopolyspora sp. NPDC050389 TaxID=3155516 RepID=UPI00340DE3DF
MGSGVEWYERLSKAVTLQGDDAALVVHGRFEPSGGRDARVFPPTYPVDAVARDERQLPYVVEPRLVDGAEVPTVLLDSVQSQSNRLEEAAERAVREQRLGLPYLLVEHELPTGQVVRISSFTAPHRYADAYFRDSLLDGVVFDKTELGRRLRAVTEDDAQVLFEREPLSVLLGAWDTHRKGARPARFPRVYRSEIFGTRPEFGVRAAGRLDPHNITTAGVVTNPEQATDGSGGWEYVVGGKAKGAKPSAVGHGNIAPGAAHGGATVAEIRRVASLSMAGLARLRFGDASAEAAHAARVALAALALVLDRLTFEPAGLWLRSGCDLVTTSEQIAWQRRGGDLEPVSVTAAEAVALFGYARQQAAEAGLVMSEEVVRLVPGPKNLAKALNHAYLAAEPEQA